MKTLLSSLIALSFFAVSSAAAHDSYLGRAPERGILISVKPAKETSKASEKVSLKGTIKVVGKPKHKEFFDKLKNRHKDDGLLEEFKKQGVDIVASFPSPAVDVSSQLQLKSLSDDEIEYFFESGALAPGDANQFSVKVFNNHKDKERLKRLSIIQAKIEKRLRLLIEIKDKYENNKALKNVIAVFEREIEKLKSISNRISVRINSDENLLAENTYSLQVDNLTSKGSRISTVMNKFRFIIEADPGNAIEGMKSSFKSRVVYLSKSFGGGDEKDDENHFSQWNNKKDSYLAEFYFNGIKIDSKSAKGDAKEIDFTKNFLSEALRSQKSNIFSVALFHSDSGKSYKKMGSLVYDLPVTTDTIKPQWLSESVPSSQDRYVKTPRAVSLITADEFGRIDASSFQASLSGSTVAGVSYQRDLSEILSAQKVGDGWGSSWSGDINPLEEGEYTLKADVRDLIGNQADEFSFVFRVDRTAPEIGLALEENPLTNKFTYDLPIYIRDLSPTFTEVYVNDQLFFITGSKEFVATLNLNLEGVNRIKVVSSDLAGNVSKTHETTVVRDTTPALLSLVTPLEGDYVNGVHFGINGTSNEKITSLSVNGQMLAIGSTQISFEGAFRSLEEGSLTLQFESKDLAGNIGVQSIKVNVQLRALSESLVGLYGDEKEERLIVKGAAGATRPFLTVNVSGGFFNSGSVQADSRGAFEIAIKPTSKVKVSVYDPFRNETMEATLVWGADRDYILSGTVRDTSNKVLAGAVVRVLGTSLITTTDTNGVFSFSRQQYPNVLLTGDQQISVDGSTVPSVEGETPRKFSTTTVAITLGLKQSNILQTPIYLTPTLLDGSAQEVSASNGGVVSNIHAPGVSLNIPSNATVFPTSKPADHISMTTIPAEFATVPPVPEAMPKTVVALEPSGTTFTKPVELSLPNYNAFPPKTDMIIMLMNSKTGKWEIGGSATVSEDGAAVKTKPGQGIRHFSLTYATIAGPSIMQRGAQDRPGADTFNGAVTGRIDLPGFKIMGQSVAPSLVYKSTWAKPSIVVTNILDFPNKKIEVTPEKVYGSKVDKYSMDFINCKWPFYVDTSKGGDGKPLPPGGIPDGCWKDTKEFYTNFQYETEFSNVTSEIQPEKVIANFKTGALRAVPYEFNNLPRMANISFALDLLDDSTSTKYFESGVYPYQAHYDVHFKELIVGTSQTKYWNNVMDAQTSSPREFSETYDRTFTQDLTESIFVQNYRSSSAGIGWRVGGYQRILNPSGNKLAIEEGDGQISSYSLKNTIYTVYDGNSLNVDVKKGVALNNWPIVAVGGKNPNEVYRLDSSSGSPSKALLGTNYSLAGTIQGFDFYNYDTQSCYTERYCSRRISGFGGNVCVEYSTRTICNNVPNSYCSRHAYNYQWNSMPSQMILLNDEVIGLDVHRHSLFKTSGSLSQKIMGLEVGAQTFANQYQSQADTHDGQVRNTCSSSAGLSCSSGVGGVETRAEYHSCGSYPASSGVFPSAGDGGLNTPMGLTAGISPDIVVIADTGNHKVRWVNTVTRESGVLAGNGSTVDAGDEGPATQAAVPHPQGVVYDSSGNLYISTKTGFIRKVDSNGIITTIAGDPVNGKLSNETAASEALFNNPYGLVVDSSKGFLYVADTGHNRIVRIDLQSGVTSTVAGRGNPGFSGDGGSALDAAISAPTLLGLDGNGNLIVVDSGNNRIRQILFQNTSGGTLAFAPTAEDHSNLTKLADGKFVRTLRSGSVIRYNEQGYQVSESDRAGRMTQLEYDGEQRLFRVSFPTGQFIQYNYAGEKLGSILDVAGRVTEFSYDFSGNLKKVKYPDGTTKSFEYNAQSLLTGEIDATGAKTQYEYNTQSRLYRVIASDGAQTIVNDLASQNLQNYDPSKVNTPKASGAGEGQVADHVTDANGHTTEISKDILGMISTVVDAKGNVSTIKRDEKGRAVEITSADGAVVKNLYNEYSDLIRTEDLTLGIIEEKTFDQWGHILSEKDGRGFVFGKEYSDTNGLLLKETAPNGVVAEYSYNSLGLVTSKSLKAPNGQSQIVQYEYDSLGRVIKEIQVDEKFTVFEYDLAGNVVKSVVRITDSSMAETVYSYDLFNRLTQVTSPKGEVTKYVYTKLGDLEKVIDPKNRETLFAYDSRRRLLQKTDSTGEVYGFTYDALGNVVTETDPKGQVRGYSYNELNKLIQAQFPDDNVKYKYNIRGEVVEIENAASVISYTRDSGNRVTQSQSIGLGVMSNYPQVSMSHNYDANGNRVQMTSSVSSLGYGYDSLDRLARMENSSGSVFDFSYDGLGRLASLQRPGSRTDFVFTGNVIQSMIHSSGGVTKSFVEYSYNERNYPVSKRNPAGTLAFGYDLNGQLTNASGVGTAESFAYDSLGNRTTDQNGSFTYNDQTQRLTEDWQYHYLYDANGNLIQKFPKDQTKNAWLYSYSSKNQLIKVQLLDKPLGEVIKQVDYQYDALGRRMQKSVWDKNHETDPKKTYVRKYVYDGDNVLAEYDQGNQLIARYTHSPIMPDDILEAEISSEGVSAGLAQNAGKYYYLKDALGSVTDIVDGDGNIIQRYDYEAFGKIRSIKTADGVEVTSAPLLSTSYTYTGREWDEETGLYYYRARYYDAGIGRFIQKDPHPGSLRSPLTVVNGYSYVSNSPTIATDPSGKFLFLAFAVAFIKTVAVSAVVGAVVGGTISGLMAANKGGNFWSSFSAGFKVGAISGAANGALFGAAAFGLGAAGAALFPTAAASTIQNGVGLVMAAYGAYAGSKYGFVGAVLGATAGYIGGTLGAGAGIQGWHAGAGIGAYTPGTALEPIVAPEPVVPTIEEFQPPPKQAPIPVGQKG